MARERVRIIQGNIEDYIEIRYGNFIIVVDCEGDPETDGVRIYKDEFITMHDVEFRNIPGFVPPTTEDQ